MCIMLVDGFHRLKQTHHHYVSGLCVCVIMLEVSDEQINGLLTRFIRSSNMTTAESVSDRLAGWLQ